MPTVSKQRWGRRTGSGVQALLLGHHLLPTRNIVVDCVAYSWAQMDRRTSGPAQRAAAPGMLGPPLQQQLQVNRIIIS